MANHLLFIIAILGALPFIDKRGYLYKMGGKHKSWHLRYFVLQPGVFHYYKNEPVSRKVDNILSLTIFCFYFRKEKHWAKLNLKTSK